LLPELAQQHLPGLLFILFAGALVSAILSTVDSTLLAASALVSHNVIVAFRPTLGDAARLKLARTGVAVMGIIACGLALGSDSIFELVQMANGIGSGGIFVLMCFGLFSRRGGKVAALACIVTGTVTWAVPTVWMPEFPAPYLLSLVAALAAFVIGAQLETPTPPARAETSGAATP
jgi:Na+/proline symporter